MKIARASLDETANSNWMRQVPYSHHFSVGWQDFDGHGAEDQSKEMV